MNLSCLGCDCVRVLLPQFGRLLRYLESSKLADNTYIMFSGDNGAAGTNSCLIQEAVHALAAQSMGYRIVQCRNSEGGVLSIVCGMCLALATII